MTLFCNYPRLQRAKTMLNAGILAASSPMMSLFSSMSRSTGSLVLVRTTVQPLEASFISREQYRLESSNMDRPLDDRIAERQQTRSSRGPPPRRPRPTYPRDGVRKSTREDRANLDNDWVHDRYDDEGSPNHGGYSRSRPRRDDTRDERRSPEPDRTPLPAKLRIDNLHYDLTEDQIYDLFVKIGPVRDAKLTYDRAGRSEGVAFVTYDRIADAREAIREFDGANAKGQPIRITLLPPPPRGMTKRDNPFDRVVNPRSLADRIEAPPGRDKRRSGSPTSDPEDYSRNGSRRPLRGERRSNVSKPAPDNIDRYVPGQGGRDSSRRGGRRPGERRERKPEVGAARAATRPKKTAEQLDAEMDDYWGKQDTPGGDAPGVQDSGATAAAGQTATDDIDMIE